MSVRTVPEGQNCTSESNTQHGRTGGIGNMFQYYFKFTQKKSEQWLSTLKTN